MPNGTTLQKYKKLGNYYYYYYHYHHYHYYTPYFFDEKYFYGYCVTTLCVTSQDYSSALGMVICDFHGNINLILCSSRAEASVGIIIMEFIFYTSEMAGTIRTFILRDCTSVKEIVFS